MQHSYRMQHSYSKQRCQLLNGHLLPERRHGWEWGPPTLAPQPGGKLLSPSSPHAPLGLTPPAVRTSKFFPSGRADLLAPATPLSAAAHLYISVCAPAIGMSG